MEGLIGTQYWLAELDQYGNPKLIDGAHSSAQGANQAAFLITAMNLGLPNRKFAVARVELYECKPSAAGVNLEAVRTINNAKEFVRKTDNPKPVKSCNRHVDCEMSEQVFKEKNGRLPNLGFHCHDDECEDCFGC